MNTTSHILELNNLSIGYKNSLLTNINTEINTGEVVLLIGKNGSGKTSLLKTILKEIPSLQGQIKISGLDLKKITASEIGKLIAVVLSKNTSINPSLTVSDLISLGRYPYKKWYQPLSKSELNTIHSTINLLELTQYKNYSISELSDGNLQKTLIARALVQDTPLLILDEPTSHLDISNKLEIIQILKYLSKEKGKTILFTSHDLELGLNIADKLWLIKDSEFKTGFTEDLAYKENILNYFSNNSLVFDYSTQEYKINNPLEALPKIKVMGNSPAIFWLKKALIKNNFQITEEAEILIFEHQDLFILEYTTEKYSFSSINKVIDFVINYH